MTSKALTEYIHKEMDILGDKNNLIQVLEKILCRHVRTPHDDLCFLNFCGFQGHTVA